MKISIINESGNVLCLNPEMFTFSGGEEHIKLPVKDFESAIKVSIFYRLNSSCSIMRLMLAVDAINRLSNESLPIELVMPYFPYARQDRVCVSGESLGASVMAKLINSLNFSKVTIWDAHSDVSPALLDRVTNIPQVELLKREQTLVEKLSNGELTLVAPDAGASKKTLKIAEQFGSEIIQAQKIRNVHTGEIIKTEIIGDIKGKSLLIADDICDGGRTFIELAKVLKSRGAGDISLFVTHGIFSKGLDVFEGLIETIYTTNSFRAVDEFPTTKQITLKIIQG